MLQDTVVLLICLLFGLTCLAVTAWTLISGQLLTLDGLMLTAISFLLGGLFLANFAWSVHTGEVGEILNYFREKRGKALSDTADGPAQGAG